MGQQRRRERGQVSSDIGSRPDPLPSLPVNYHGKIILSEPLVILTTILIIQDIRSVEESLEPLDEGRS